MKHNRWRPFALVQELAGLSAPFIVNCGALQSMNSILPDGAPGKCPDMSNVDAIDKFDFAGSFKLAPDVAAKVKTSAGAAVEMKALADKIDAGLLEACGGLSKDLGDATVYPNGQAACAGALKALSDTRAKIGAGASVKLDVDEPQCSVDTQAFTDCAAGCEPKVKAGSLKAECEGKVQGTCSGVCKGRCDMSAAASCSGDCNGNCDATVSGTCDGTCSGTCDGQAIAGDGATCAGKCDGKCTGHVKGTCSGQCQGSCKVTDGAACSGTCTGECSVAMESPKCMGSVKLPEVNPNCKAKCDAKVQANVVCTPPRVALLITGASDAEAAAKLKAAIEKNFPRIIDVGRGLGRNAVKIGENVVTIVQGGQAVVQTAMGGDKVLGPMLVACVTQPYVNALSAAANITASVKVSVDVTAKASAAGSAGTN
jgi:hypothetical protein